MIGMDVFAVAIAHHSAIGFNHADTDLLTVSGHHISNRLRHSFRIGLNLFTLQGKCRQDHIQLPLKFHVVALSHLERRN